MIVLTEDKKEEAPHEKINYINLAEFLENSPPNQMIYISDLAEYKERGYNFFPVMKKPDLQLPCSHDSCNGLRFFRCTSTTEYKLTPEDFIYFYMTYRCSNCQRTEKTFFLAAEVTESLKKPGQCYKFGEFPPYGPLVSPKLIKLIGPDRDEFLKGRTSENQGLGVAAFTYYRRVVENQKNRILEKIIKVSETLKASEDNINTLKNAVKETQFSKALKMSKDVIPESLLINGNNPLLLLHGALSEGIHAKTDEECMELASSVRVVLAELSDRLSQALKDEAELKKAISILNNRKKAD